jgi:hypothetical protein
VPTSVASATFADFTGHAANAVTATMTSTAHPAVVIALLISAWRDRQSRYSPTTPSVTMPKTLKTFS